MLTLLGMSVADLLEIRCLVRVDGRLTAWEGIVESWLTLWGIKISWLHSSAELSLVPWWTEQLDRFRQLIIAPVSDVGEEDTLWSVRQLPIRQIFFWKASDEVTGHSRTL